MNSRPGFRPPSPRPPSPRAQVSHAFVILFSLVLISLTIWVFSGLERRLVEEDFQCEPLLEDTHSELILSEVYASRYSHYERTLSIPGNEILFTRNRISCGPHFRETNINLAGLGSFREGLHILKYENGDRV